MRPDLDFFFFFFCSFKSEQTVEGETRRWLTYFYGNWCVDEFVLLLHWLVQLLHISHDCIVQLWNKKKKKKEITCSKPGYSHWLCNCSLYIEEAVFFCFCCCLCCNMDFIYCLYVFIIKNTYLCLDPVCFISARTTIERHVKRSNAATVLSF